MEVVSQQQSEKDRPKWRPLDARQRRVLGVLIEKAKTTPDNYPISLNGLTSGCNQKSNRQPQMNLTSEEVGDSLDELREMGAAAEIFGGGRVAKYRHYAKEWLGVDGNELAVMAELMLRGEQTVGELRGRAARMAEIRSLGELQPLIESLTGKRLVVPLSPPGRGQTVTHGLFTDREMNDLCRRHDAAAPAGVRGAAPDQVPPGAKEAARETRDASEAAGATAISAPAKPIPGDVISEIRLDIAQLRVDLAQLKQQVDDLRGSSTGRGQTES